MRLSLAPLRPPVNVCLCKTAEQFWICKTSGCCRWLPMRNRDSHSLALCAISLRSIRNRQSAFLSFFFFPSVGRLRTVFACFSCICKWLLVADEPHFSLARRLANWISLSPWPKSDPWCFLSVEDKMAKVTDGWICEMTGRSNGGRQLFQTMLTVAMTPPHGRRNGAASDARFESTSRQRPQRACDH